jgi:hypothetical protein
MAVQTCHNCMYSCCDPELWLRRSWAGQPLLPRCANHPCWPGQMHDVTGIPCRNYRPKPVLPKGNDVRLIPLGDGCYAYVDAADYEWLNQWTWHQGWSGYAARGDGGKTILMHRQIMQPPEGMLVDHIDGNGGNNCRCNLRICTHQENQRNMRKQKRAVSRFKGAFYDKRYDRWYSRYRYGGKYQFLGYFDTEIEAAQAYDLAAVQWFGEFANLNFPQDWPPQRRKEVCAQRDAMETKGKRPRRKRGPRQKDPDSRGDAGTQRDKPTAEGEKVGG